MTRPLRIDGSYGEGGGQILRTAVALSAITGKPVEIVNIRARRPKPGLKRQHLTAIRAASEIAGAEVEGLYLGSTRIVFRPTSIRSGTYIFDIGTAGSITLLLQALLPIIAYAPGPVEVRVRGGTDVPWSPPIDYLRNVIAHYLRKFGYGPEIELVRRGHYPRGGGLVVARVRNPPRGFEPVRLVRRGDVTEVRGVSHCVRLPKHVAERQARAAEEEIRGAGLHAPVRIEIEWYEPRRDPHLGPGSGIVIWAEAGEARIGGDSLGARGKRAEAVGREAAEKMLRDLATGAALDTHMSDNVIPYAALAEGVSELGGAQLTMHTYTNAWLVKQILGVELELQGRIGEPFMMRIRGAGIRT